MLRATTAAAGLALLVVPLLGATTEPTVERGARVVFADRGLAVTPTRLETMGDRTLIVVFHVRNSTRTGRRLVIGAFRSAVVPPGVTRNYSVAFRHLGRIAVRAVPGPGRRTVTIAR